MIDLSILVASVHTRYQTFAPKIMEQLWTQLASLPQTDQDRVEILFLMDNKQSMLGKKRNDMAQLAQGRYIQYIDDDDRIAPDMFRCLLDAIDVSDADCITFQAAVSIDGGPAKICYYSKDYGYDYNTNDAYYRIPNHRSCIKREHFLAVKFHDVIYAEDREFSPRFLPLNKNEYAINKVLYYYDADSATTEPQHRVHHNSDSALVDVVMLSNAKTPELRAMTETCIENLFDTTHGIDINVFIMEQQKSVEYKNVFTYHPEGEFNFNKFANIGIEIGNAEWFVLANNDLEFQPGWLDELLAADYPVVSSKNPGDARQEDIMVNTKGDAVSRHFSGWCFMMRGDIWEQINGFDERVNFWCSDDAVIEQLRAIDIEPMLVPSSLVKHCPSTTLDTVTSDKYDLTYRNVKIFNEIYHKNKYADYDDYQRWLKTCS